MCGLVGVLSLVGNPISPDRLQAMATSISHRGPDDSGIQAFDAIGLGHRRLSIIDLSSAGSQPMTYLDRYTIVYNGEIYNYVELRDELRGLGYSFRSESDTEVLAAAIACWGKDALRRLDGMFAFACWDAERKTLFCARDRFGEKPFFYTQREGSFIFGSEIKALRAAGVRLSVNEEMLLLYLQHEVVQSLETPEASFYRGVLSLKPAHWLEVDAQSRTVGPQVQFWRLSAQTSTLPEPERVERFRELFERSVRRRMRSDVAIGTSVSGGIDSSSIACVMASIKPDADRHGFSARFDDPLLDEGGYMEIVQKKANLRWMQVRPTGAGLVAEIDRLFHHQEEPFLGASTYAQWCVMRLARESGTKVLLDGQGADEFLAGYHHFFRPFLAGLLRTNPAMYRRSRAAVAGISQVVATDASSWHFIARSLFPGTFLALGRARRGMGGTHVPAWLRRGWANDRLSPPPFRFHESLDSALRFFTVEYGLRTLLRYSDRSAMAFGVEVRLPFLAHELVDFAFSCPDSDKIRDGSTKHILRAAVDGIVPDQIRLRKDKLGFQPPEAAWMKEPAMVRRTRDAFESLRSRGIVVGSAPPDADIGWKLLMADLTFRFAEGQA